MAAFRQLHGLNAIAVLDGQSGQLAAAKNGSPLVLGWGDDGHLLASDQCALLEHTRRLTFVEDGQAALLTADGVRLFDVDSGRELPARGHGHRVARPAPATARATRTS